MQPFVSIIIPVRNAARTIDTTFNYLLKVEYPRDKMEIIIADGGSSDDTVKIIERWGKTHPFIKWIQIPNCPSPAFARNKALGIASGEFIFFTDGDCAPSSDWITEILSKFQMDDKIGGVGGEIYTLRVDKDNPTEAFCEHFRFNMVSPRYGFIGEGYFPALTDKRPTQIAGHRAYFFSTANVAYRKKAIDETGARFWDNPTGEDVDFATQMQEHNWRLYFAPKAKVDHIHRSSFKALRKVWVTYGMAHPQLLAKHSKNFLEIILQFIKGNPTITIPSPIRGFIYLGNFHLMHIFGLLTLILLLVGAFSGYNLSVWLYTGICALFFIYFVFGFFGTCFSMEPKKRIFTWFMMKYMTNLCFVIGGLKQSAKYRTLCIEPSF